MTATTKQFIAKNGLDNNNNIITNVSNPISNTDAANKQYVDTKLPNTKDVSSVSLTSSTLTITKADATFVNTSIPTWNQSTTGNAATANKLTTPRTISISGDATWSVSFDGQNNVSANLILSNNPTTRANLGLGTVAVYDIGNNSSDISINKNLFQNTFNSDITTYSKSDNIDCNTLAAGTKFLISIWSLNAPPIDGLGNLDSLIYGQNSYGDKDAFYYIETKSLTASNKIQTAIGQLSAVMYIRTCIDGIWSQWTHTSTSPNVFQNTTEDYPNLTVLPDGQLKRSNKQLGNVVEKNIDEPYGVPTLDGYGKIQNENLPVITYQGVQGDVQLNYNTYVSAQDIVTLNSAARYAGDTTDYVPLPTSAYIDYGNQDPNTANNVTLNIIDSHGNLFMTDMRKSNGISTLRRLAMIF
jgi:hypothetical protein